MGRLVQHGRRHQRTLIQRKKTNMQPGEKKPHRSWLRKLIERYRITKLERELRQSRQFQNYCSKNQFHYLAELEGANVQRIENEIARLHDCPPNGSMGLS